MPVKIFCYYLIFRLETLNERWANQCIVTELDTTHCWCQRSPTQSNGESPWNAGTAPILLQRRKSTLLELDKEGYRPHAERTDCFAGLPQEKHPKSSFCCKDLLLSPVYVSLTPQLERWKETLVTFISQHKAVLYCNVHLSFPRRGRNKHQHILYRSKTKQFNTFLHEKPLGKFSNPALQKAREWWLPSPKEKQGRSWD